MKKRILSIFITICMAVAIMPMMPTASASAEELERWEDCTCLIHCTDDNMKADCPRCSKEGAKAVDCLGRNLWGKFFDTTGLQNAMNLSATYPTLYYQVDDDDFEGYNGVVKLNNTITVPENANAVIDLNGRTISGNSVCKIFDVYGKLTIIDTKGGGKLTMGSAGAMTIEDGGYVLMQGGTIEENSNGGVFVKPGGTFEMTGGTLVKNDVMQFTSSTLVVTNLLVYGGGTCIIDGDAEILTDRQGKQYGGNVVQFYDNYYGESKNKSILYADGGVIDGTISNEGFITSTHAGEWAIFKRKMENTGIIAAGKYTGEVTNTENGTISDGSFESKVTNNGLVNGGTFDAEVDNQAKGTISGGTFSENSVVKNAGTISGGTFLGTVESENGTIEDSAKVSVHFVNEAGENIKTVRVLRGQGISADDLSALIDPTQYGYNIARYYIGDEEYKGGGHFTEDETYVTVKLFSPLQYTITCVLNNGQKDQTYNYTVTDPDFTLTNPTKDGYVFVGWSRTDVQEVYDRALTVTIPQGSIGDRTYTAEYMKDWSGEVVMNSYSIVFDTQGGNPIASKTELTTSDKVLEGVKDPTKAGYRFMWWKCGGKPVVLADTTVEDLKGKADKGVITLTAVWMEKTEVTFSTDAQEYTYDGTGKVFEIKDTNIANPDGFNVTYRQNGSAVDTPTDVGAYDVIITREEDDNCKAVNETIKNGLVIKPQEVTVTIGEIPDQTYTGKEIEPVIKVYVGTDEIPSSEYTVEYANNKNAGTATVTVTDKAGGNYTFTQISKNFTINKKSITPAVAMADYVYGTMPDYPEVSGNEGGGAVNIYYSTNDDIATNTESRQVLNVAEMNGTALNAGTYYMLVEVAETQNYNAGTGRVITFKVMPNKYEAPAAPTLDGSTVTIGEADRSKALEYSLNGGAWADVPQLDANGSFTLSDLDNNGYTIALRQQASTDGNYAASDAVSCFSVAYNANGGTGTVPFTYAPSGSAITVAAGDSLQRKGYTFVGWNTEADGTGTAYTPGSSVTTGATLYAQWTANRYTVTFDTVGGTEIASKTTVQWTDAVLDGVSEPTRDGWKFTGWKYGDVTVTPQTTYKELAVDGSVSSIELKAQWEDIAAPTGEIRIGENSWKEFLNKITFGLFFKDTKTVTITASDNSGEAVTISYLLSDKALTADDLAGKEFIAYTGGFDIEPNNEWIIYVMLTDEAGNVTYLSSDGIVLDNVAPVISGVKNGKTYCGAQTVTVDEKYIDSVTVNGKEVTLQNNQFTLPAAEGTQKILATDKAGNVSAEITVTVNDGHTDENKDHKCDYCGVTFSEHTGGTATCKDKAVCDYCGMEYGELDSSNHAGGTEIRDAKAENCTETGYTGDTFCVSCGEKLSEGKVIPKLSHKDKDKDHLCDVCGATLSEHTGGEATCKDKAVCDYCGKEYSDFDFDKHTGGTEIRDAKAESCTETGYTGDTFCVGCGEKLSEGEVIPKLSHKDKDKDHLCDVCRIRLSEHTGGTATCTEKAVCEYCHKEYGEPKGHNYTESIIAPTEFTLGGTKHTCSNCGDEYWYNFTKEDTSYKLVMPGGITLYDYFTISEEPEIAVEGNFDNPVVSVFLQDQLGTLKRMEDDGIKLYKITEGAEQVVVRSDKKIVFRSDAPFDEFDKVMINGLVLDKKYYSVKKGSTIVTLNEDFAKEIPTGMHLFGIISKDGVAITTFTVDDKAEDNNTDSPQTGDNSHMALWIALLFVGGGLLTVTGVYGKRKTQSKN